MSIWERKALNFINQTGRWDKDKHISSFLAFSIALVKSLMEADIALQLEFEDEETAKVKCASPLHLNGLVLNPAPIKKLLYTEDFKTIYWREIPPAKENVFKEILPALSSAIIIPVDTSPNNSLLVLGWSEPASFEPGFLECIETIRLRLKEILVQSQQQIYFQRVAIRFAAILHTIPHALVFINNDGVSGWVNQEGANLLGLSGPGEQLPAILSDAMTQLRNKALNITTIEKAAVPLFSSPENSISNWSWQMENKLLLVSCLPVTTQQICGRLWIFENGDQ
ncbi:hypothetical protein SAMN05660461_0863 [Chitinophaga ginsengisegetis]|uniref:PAS domain-containing protein n=1 Tax=Chitinophaga ginsengisegetis TaxID=393003 RepID=A0A1T5N9N5_9BACT|nr:hypothetical protein [Chitinophaga ginsengisegetis]SKC97170.1 hypothetical protein SAMN05660461_0863 [Chitinophaga ginsengisegetis]